MPGTYVLNFGHLNFEFVSNFGFRISNFPPISSKVPLPVPTQSWFLPEWLLGQRRRR